MLARQIIKQFLLYALVIVALILMVLLPRDVDMNAASLYETKYQFSVEKYTHNITTFFGNLYENHNLGTTHKGDPVVGEMKRALPRTLWVIFLGFLLSIIGGIMKGIFDYRHKGIIGRGITWITSALPDFSLVIFVQLMIIFYLPVFKEYTFGYDNPLSIILPTILVSLYPLLYMARITSSAIESQEGETYILVARGKGFTEKQVLYRHVLKNCYGKIFSHFQSVMVLLISNLLVVEFLMDFKGAATRFFYSLDYSTIVLISGNKKYEPSMIIGLGMCFMIMIFLAQVLGQIGKFFFDPEQSRIELIKQIGKTLGTYLIVSFAIIFMILLPRDADAEVVKTMSTKYEFSWEKYGQNITHFIEYVKDNHSLGLTKKNLIIEDELARFLPRSLKIIGIAFIVSLLVGLLKGIFDFKQRRNKVGRLLGNGTTFVISSLPDFFLIICIQLGIILFFPGLREYAFGYEETYSFIIPTILVSMFPVLYLSRITSSALANQEGLPYIQTARAKGFAEGYIIRKHMLRNCYGTIISHIPTVLLLVISNLMITEVIMDYKGIAYRFFVAMGYSKTVTIGQESSYEGGVVIGIALLFLVGLLLIQIFCTLLKYKLDPGRKSE